MNTVHRCVVGVLTLSVVALAIPAAPAGTLRLSFDGESHRLSLNGDAAFHVTANQVQNQRLVELPGSPTLLILWDELPADGKTLSYYAISLDGQTIARVRQASYVLKLRHGDFDPAVAVPPPDAGLAAGADANLYIVQFRTQPLEEFRTAIRSLGGTVYQFLANHAHFVRMTPEVRDQVAALPYVRWIGPVHPAYKLEEAIRDQIRSGVVVEPRRYSIMLHERGVAAQDRVCARIEAIGGQVHGTTPRGFRIEATMSLDQVRRIAALDDVMFIDRKGQTEVDMDIVREIGGANYIESIAGYTGQGVRAEVADTEIDVDHQEWAAPPIIHRAGSDLEHGTSVYGILFAQGVVPQARGLIPDGVGIFACSTNGLLGGGPTRYEHTAELVDPDGPYRAVFQTNSTGDPRTYYYTTISAEMDDMLFMYDIVLTQSQSNAGDQDSRPQAWAKNVISGGAVNHYNTLTRDDDCWCYDASIGPADDGRIKPDLCFFYDDTYTTEAGNSYTEFGGTSGATPCIAGHVGLFFQMWSDGIFGNEDEVDPNATVFENRCHMTTAKAVMINTATQYPFSGTGHDLTRVHQGWGMPDVAYLLNMRDNISILDETEVLGNLESGEYVAYVEPNTPELRVTMVYADPAGVPGSPQHRINDLTLHVVSPSATEYWGNNGLLEGNWSTPGGVANEIDTVENVFIENPESGVWEVTVIASEVNEDGHVETPELDADFALVVSGGLLATCTSDGRVRLNKGKYQCEDHATIRVVDCDLNTDPNSVETVTVTIDSTTEPAGESVLLTETAAETADFRGVMNLSTVDAAGILQVSEGDVVTVTYEDADDGTGNPATVQDTAVVDCTAPSIFNVQIVDIGPRDATVTFETDEPTVGSVRYGESCGALTETATQAGYGTEHSVHLSGLTDNTTYFIVVDAQDEAGNAATDDNGGSCYTFDTTDIPDFFTEEFGSDNDLDYLSLYFTPNGSVDYYGGCTEEIDSLPTDPSGGTALSISEDSYQQVSLGGGETVSLYGTSYSSFYVCDNGYITFTGSDTDYTESLEDHFDMPRISAVFDDFSVDNYDGFVSWKQEADRAVVTYENVPEYGTSNHNTFQVEMYFNGDITISYLALDAGDGLAGLSEGNGLDPDFYETDLSAMGSCGPRPPTAENDSVTTEVNIAVAITLTASDDGLPEPPALDYIIVALPANGTLSDPGAGIIDSVPYTLVGGGNLVQYDPDHDYIGPDSFTFKANDGGTPPDGGDSNVATIYVEVTPPVPQPVYDFPLDTDPGWSVEGQWAFGQPTGGGSHDGDPTSGYTGSNVYGYNLNGDYAVSIPVYYLTTTAIDCSNLTEVELRFWRWLGVESSNFDHATVEVSNDGSVWTTLWENPLDSISDASWSQIVFDLSAIADGEPTVYLRWSMGPTDPSVTYPGWNIDDIEIWATVAECPGDLDGDNDVDLADLAELLANYGTTSGAVYEDGDLDGDGDVDLADLAELLSLYGTTC